MNIRLLIADDDALVRLGLEKLFSGTDIRIVAQAASGDEAVRLAVELRPQVVLIEARMAAGDGLAALEKIRSQSPESRVVLISAYDNPTYMARAVALGAADFLPKTAAGDEIVAAVSAAANGAGGQPTRLDAIAATLRNSEPAGEAEVGLTERECQVVRHLAYGLSNREIGYSLKISVETVKEHVQNVLRKLKAADRTQAAVWALRQKMV